ncbi:MAG TPA: hypothetical protein VIK84_06440 [Haloplasmataceae bacterium]
MFALNFKKEWKFHKSLFLTLFFITLGLFIVISSIYLFLKYNEISEMTYAILIGIWSLATMVVALLSSISPIVLIYLVLKNDLGKNRVHYTIFTPQSIFMWFLPKLLFIFIIQGFFALISTGSSFLMADLTNQPLFDNIEDKIIAFISETFSLGITGVITLATALYYSFRKKGKAWLMIIILIIFYFIMATIPTIVTISIEGAEALIVTSTRNLLLSLGVDLLVGISYILLALYLFNKKIEY